MFLGIKTIIRPAIHYCLKYLNGQEKSMYRKFVLGDENVEVDGQNYRKRTLHINE